MKSIRSSFLKSIGSNFTQMKAIGLKQYRRNSETIFAKCEKRMTIIKAIGLKSLEKVTKSRKF